MSKDCLNASSHQPFGVIFADDALLVIDKPTGLVVDGEGGVLPIVREKFADAQLVHRLDRETSGAMVVAKNLHGRDLLQTQFKERCVQKDYLAILDGNLPADYLAQESYLARNPRHRLQRQSTATLANPRTQRFARSEFFVQERFLNRLTLAKVRIATGRTHQIRVHAKDASTPVLGDKLYHRPTILPRSFPTEVREEVRCVARQMLHAHTLGFIHPTTRQPMRCTAPLPADFRDLLTLLRACRHV